MMAMALLKNYKPFEAPPSLALYDLFKKFDKTWALTKGADTKYGRTSPERTYEDAMKRRQSDPWNFLFIAGMWFQDLFNYDFRRTEMCIIPYATQQGEISFCAYNTGIGWRKIIENMYKNATVAQWYKTHGKHEIYAKGKKVDLNSYEHSLRIDAEDAARIRHLEHDIPQTAAEEDRIRRTAGHGRSRQGPQNLRRAGAQEGPGDGSADRQRSSYQSSHARRAGRPSVHPASKRQWPFQWQWQRTLQRQRKRQWREVSSSSRKARGRRSRRLNLDDEKIKSLAPAVTAGAIYFWGDRFALTATWHRLSSALSGQSDLFRFVGHARGCHWPSRR